MGKPDQKTPCRWTPYFDTDFRQLILERWKRRRSREELIAKQRLAKRANEAAKRVVKQQIVSRRKGHGRSKLLPTAKVARTDSQLSGSDTGDADPVSAAKKVIEDHSSSWMLLVKVHGPTSIPGAVIMAVQAQSEKRFAQEMKKF